MHFPLTGNEVSSYDNLKFIQNLKELTASIDEGIIITDEKENILWVNKALEKICGNTLAELRGKKPNTLQGKDTNPDTVKEIRNAVKNMLLIDTEILNYRPDNTPYWIKLNISPIKDNNGLLTNFVAFEHDITHEKDIALILAKTEREYKDLFEKNPCVMWICDTVNFKFIEVNRAAIDKYGYTREEFMKMSLKDVKTAEDIEHLDATFSDETETYRDRGIVEHYKKNGESIFVEVKTNRVNYAGQSCSLALLNDVTDRVRKENEIKKLDKELQLRIVESDKNNAELAKANQRYEFISKAANETIWDLDLETNIISFGGCYKEMFGYTYPDDKIELSKIQHILHHDDIERVSKSIAEALGNPSHRFWEGYYRVIKKGGGIVYVYDRAYVIYDEHTGKAVRFVGVIQDITQHKKDEEELQSNAKFIKEISDSLSGFIFQVEYNADGFAKVNYVSKKAADYMNISVEEAISDGSKILDFIHPEDIEFAKESSRDMIANLKETDFKLRYHDKVTDQINWIKIAATPTRLKNGNTLVNGIVIDITEIENNFKQLEEANSRYEFLSEATHETIWELNLATKKLILSGGYSEMFGIEYFQNKMTYDRWKQFVHSDDLAYVIKCMEDALAEPGKKYYECSYRMVRGNSTVIDVFEKVYIINEPRTGKAVKLIGSTQDVTVLKKIQKEKDNLIKDLIKRNQVLEQFTFMVSHNLRAPIANLMGIHEILEDESSTAEEREAMYALNKKSVYRLNDVITDMNEILSIKKNMDEDRNVIVFADTLKEVNDEAHATLSKTRLVIKSDFSKAGSIFSIPSYIRSIFQNLITNSIKYRHDGSSYIKINSDEDENYIYLTFEDDGMGIDLSKNHNKVFGLYNRFHLGIEGKGMGLFMVKSQIESLHGEISVESKVNVGTKFFIKFKK